MRVEANFVPKWSGLYESWTWSQAYKSSYLLRSWGSEEDLVQEGWLIFHRICDRYAMVGEEGHFFTLYKTSFQNYLRDLIHRQGICRRGLDQISENYSQFGGENDRMYVEMEDSLTVMPELLPKLKYLLGKPLSIQFRQHLRFLVQGFLNGDHTREDRDCLRVLLSSSASGTLGEMQESPRTQLPSGD